MSYGNEKEADLAEIERKLRLMVVDDHEVVRRGLAMVISLEPDITVCCEAGSGAEAIKGAGELNLDIILMDLKMPGMSGLEAARAIKAEKPEIKILILTGVDADAAIFEALESGIDGYILKEVTPDELVRAVRIVAGGEAYLHPSVTRKVLSKMSRGQRASNPALASYTGKTSAIPEVRPVSANNLEKEPLEPLSEREREVLLEVALGRSNREIAESLIVSEETVRTHLKSVFRKLEVNDRTQAVVVALKHGLIGV